jgi:DNA-binding CsgD family transcriptional regulator
MAFRARFVRPSDVSACDAALTSYDAALLSDDHVVRMKAHALGAMTAVVPATMAWYLDVDRRNRWSQAIVLQTDRFDLEPADVWRGYHATIAADDPFSAASVQSRGATVLGLKDFAACDSERYVGFLAARRLGDRVDLYLRNAGAIVAQLALVRSAEAPPFASADLCALRRLQPLLEHAFACALDPDDSAVHAALVEGGLSEREAQVAELIGRGATNSEIARSLHISEATVKTHLTRVYGKVGVRTRTQLALMLGSR